MQNRFENIHDSRFRNGMTDGAHHVTGESMTIDDYIKRGKDLIADWQWARVCQDEKLMDMYLNERKSMEFEIMERGDDFYCAYYYGINEK